MCNYKLILVVLLFLLVSNINKGNCEEPALDLAYYSSVTPWRTSNGFNNWGGCIELVDENDPIVTEEEREEDEYLEEYAKDSLNNDKSNTPDGNTKKRRKNNRKKKVENMDELFGDYLEYYLEKYPDGSGPTQRLLQDIWEYICEKGMC